MRLHTPERMACNSQDGCEKWFHPRPDIRMRARESHISIQRIPFKTRNDSREFLAGIELSIARGLPRFPENHVIRVTFPAWITRF